MKALAYEKAHPLEAFALELREVDEPQLRETDLLIEVRAVGVNPGEASIRQMRSAPPGGRVILGWEFAGVVAKAGNGFAVGDRVMGTGDITRDGCWAERLAVDYRVVTRIPDRLSFTDAASLPIGGLTAWEALFRDRSELPPGVENVLVVGGAGGVGSLGTQLLKAKTSALVISTASRPESREWCTAMGADLVVDHSADVAGQLRTAGVERIDLVLSTKGTAANINWLADVLKPFGHLATTDLASSTDIEPLIQKSISVHTEMVFSSVIADHNLHRQGAVLAELVEHARPIVTTELHGLTVDSMREAHRLAESGRTIGKTVITV
ncbi:NADPH:quinone reductase [Kineosporia sp. NBRC 101677]|uniref:alcohol dehydrogenase catalytic domain-containing protein n=1 Tax=Kineosporia sp. NBRC 101677 TaxID=3032197 RepID=UPI0024A22A9D|nr:zinc-binding dehydrogenase [Kineosporia sp. NBRC 101677]GLY15783.1 NADPH:quinone reductase [Kineosporia sp. NBRC 101677]